MHVLHESVVLPSEIDALGHLNVRHYLARMDRGIRTLLERQDITVAGSTVARRVDTYSRFRREQFEGAKLHTQGGTLGLTENGLQCYVEIQNSESGDVAASFIATIALVDVETQRPLPFPSALEATASEFAVEVPRYGRPRSLTLTPPRTDVDAETLDELVPETGATGMMSGKRQAIVLAEDVDENGWLREDIDVMFLPFIRQVEAGGPPPGPPVFESKDGRRIGIAMMETRNLRYRQPREGDELRYFGADIAITEKSRHSRRWAFAANGQLLGISDSVGVCIDLDARRAVDMPEDLRETAEANLLPHLA